jgi:hypothetical protein
VPRARTILLALLCAVHLGAALTPCPPRAGAPHGHATGEHPCHEAAAASLSAPCPCGCGQGSGPAPTTARLGFALLAGAPAGSIPQAIAPATAGDTRLPDPPLARIERVPWS